MNNGKELIYLLLAGYFHQDWSLEADNDLGVVRNFIDSERLRDNLPILDAIDKILLQDEAEVSSFLIESGCQYYFAADGFTAKQWLERLRSEFVNEVSSKEN